MTRKWMMCILFCFLLLPALASAQETVNISELKATAPARWTCEIRTVEGETVTIDAPVHIPDVDAVPLLMVREAPFIYELAGDESFLIGKADVRKREEILDPERFSEIGYPTEDLLDFMQEMLSSHGVTDIELVLYRVTALGSMYYVKQGKTYNKKYAFPCSVADTTKPWKNDTTCGYEITATHKVAGMPVFLSGTIYPIDSEHTHSWLYYIDRDHYSIGLNTITAEETLSPDEQLLSFDALLKILTERIRNGALKTVLEINLGYYILDQNLVNQTSETVWQLIPVWQIRGYDTSLDQLLNGILSTYSEEDRIKYDPECVYSIYINALTGELVPAE
ncbi:MAG: hypothetical protein K6A68_08920 [Clostridiales bacterium]|nr:hypothetical protein [Clostridiales bacterium]